MRQIAIFCITGTTLLTLVVVVSNAASGETNKSDVRRRIESRHETVIWSKEIDHLEYARFMASSVTPDSVSCVKGVLSALASDIAKETGARLKMENLYDLILGKKEFTDLDGRTIYVRISTYRHWQVVSVAGRQTVRIRLPNTHQFYIGMGKRPAAGGPSVAEFGTRFRAVDEWSSVNSFPAGYPTFHEALHNNVRAYRVILFLPHAIHWRDIPVLQLGSIDTPDARFRAVHDWAVRHGFRGGFPNFQEAVYEEGRVIGVYLINREFADFQDVPVEDLGNPTTMEERMRAADDLAVKKGYLSGFPTFHEAIVNGKRVFGCILIKKNAAVRRDVAASALQDAVAD
jgi:hypothetical protein